MTSPKPPSAPPAPAAPAPDAATPPAQAPSAQAPSAQAPSAQAPSAQAAQPAPAAQAPLAEALRQASKDLLVPSETDAPFEVLTLDRAPTPEGLRQASGLEADAPVESESLDGFFGPLGAERPSQDEGERAKAARFRNLHTLVRDRLEGAAVFRVGSVDIDVYIVGQDEQGAWLALKSHLVET